MPCLLAPLRRRKLERWHKKLTDVLFFDPFLEVLLQLMRLALLVRPDYRKNIEGDPQKNIEEFRGRYAFRSRNGDIAASAVFKRGRMRVRRHIIENADVTVIFKNGETLTKLVFDRNPDLIEAILDQEIRTEGNLNYLFKFVYMARQLQPQFPF
jgi:hypothetical protein